jgi:adenylate cyclase
MAKDELSRKLAVILHVDVVGSTALVQQNETIAHERMQGAFQLICSTIKSYAGIPHEIRGDAVVAEFRRASDAVASALACQAANAEINSRLDGEIRPELRMGISLGEVVIADNTITGTGVVLAQRLEQLADPGGICIQGASYETIPQRFPFEFECLGDQNLKGFDTPILTYRVALRPGELIPAPEHADEQFSAIVNRLPRTAPQDDKPSILVMPFINDSNDAEQEYVAKGITDNIIIALTRFRELFIFAYKTSMASQEVIDSPASAYEHLGANFAVEGSVRKSADRIRISARLVDTREGRHLWAQNYDRESGDFLAIQDEIAECIASALINTVEKAGGQRARKIPNNLLAPYDLTLKGRVLLNEYTLEGENAARECFQQAIDLDPDYAPAYAGMAVSYDHEYHSTWCENPEQTNQKLYEYACKALKLDDCNIMGLYALAEAYYARGEHERAVLEIDRAIASNPNDYHNVCSKGAYLTFSGQLQEGMQCSVDALSTNPFSADNCLEVIGIGEYLRENYDQALISFCKVKRNTLFKFASIAACYANLDRKVEANRARDDFLSLSGGDKTEINNWKAYWTRVYPFSDSSDRDKILAGMEKAGIPIDLEQ